MIYALSFFKYVAFTCALAMTFAHAQSSQFLDPVDSLKNKQLQEISSEFEDFMILFNNTSGSCSQLSRYSYKRDRGLITVARYSVLQSNQGYDYPMEFELLYQGDLDEMNSSFGEALRILNGARQASFVRRYYERQDNQDALDQLWVFKSRFQKQLAQLSQKSRVLVYTGVAGNSFGKNEFTVLLDPKRKELALFQAGWCE